MKKKALFFLVCLMCTLLGVFLGIILQKNYVEFNDEHQGISILSRVDTGIVPENGFVPDKKTALKIAKAIWLPIYGKKQLMCMIFQVKLVDGIWFIEGASKIHIFFGIDGGGPFIKIDKMKGTIIDVSYTG